MKYIRLSLLPFLFLFSAFVGFKSAGNLDKGWDAKSSIEQRNILIINTEDIKSENTRLKSVWLLIFYTDSPRVDLFPIFPLTGEGSEIKNLAFAEAFRLTREGKPTPEFWGEIESLKTWWDGYIILDDIVVAKLMAYFDGGKGLSSEKTKEAISEIPRWSEDPQSALEEQTDMYLVHCKKIIIDGDSADLIPLLFDLHQHTYTDMKHAQLIGIWQTIQPYSHSLNCAFPSLMASTD